MSGDGGAPPAAAAPAAAGGSASQDIEFIFPDGNTIEAALVCEMATIGDFSYLEGILGDYGVGLRVIDVTSEVSEYSESMTLYATFPDRGVVDQYGRLKVSEDMRGETVDIVVVRQT